MTTAERERATAPPRAPRGGAPAAAGAAAGGRLPLVASWRGAIAGLAAALAVAAMAGRAAASPHPGRSFDPWRDPAAYEIELRVELPRVASGGRWRVWVPLPSATHAQRVVGERIAAPVDVERTADALGNRYAYLEAAGGAVVVRATVERFPDRGIPASRVRRGGVDDPARYLGPQRGIPLDGPVAELARSAVEGRRGTAERIGAIFDLVVREMTYSKRGRGWGRGDAVWACNARRGNCTDFHSLLIAMARSQEIPARFVIGFPLPAERSSGEAVGYHCWAEVFDPDRGWLPVDASAAKRSGRGRQYLGALPSDRVAFSRGRDLVLAPAQRGAPLRFVAGPYAQAPGGSVERLPFSLRYRRVPLRASGPGRAW